MLLSTRIAILIVCCCLLLTNPVHAKPLSDSSISCVIRGKIASIAGSSLNCYAVGLLSDTSFYIPVDAKGSFNVSLHYPFLKEVRFGIDTSVYYFGIKDKDTFNLTTTEGGVFIKTADRQKTLEVNTELRHFNKWAQRRSELQTNVFVDRDFRNDKKNVASRLTSGYDNEIKDLLSDNPDLVTAQKIVTGIYYQYLSYFISGNLLPEYGLKTIVPDSYAYKSSLLLPGEHDYKKIDTALFYQSFVYRDFVYQYATHLYFNLYSEATGSSSYNESLLERDYYRVYYFIEHSSIRDWILFKMLKSYLQDKHFADFRSLLLHYNTTCRNPDYSRYLQNKYDRIKHLEVGQDAADFTLKSLNGNPVSLSDFRGKTVYIDFWGVNCGPCLLAIKRVRPQLDSLYKDVVYLNICVDSDEPAWKQKVKELHLPGVNLIAEGWEKNPVCILYDVHAIPEYYIISKSGKMIGNTTPQGIANFHQQFPDVDYFKMLDDNTQTSGR